MTTLFAVLVGAFFAAGVHLILQRDMVRLVLGFIVLSNAVNLLVFAMGRPEGAAPPLIPAAADVPLQAVADPIPQALVLTALVISAGVMAWLLALVRVAHGRTTRPHHRPDSRRP